VASIYERTSLRVILKLLKGRTHLNNHHVLSGGNFPKRSLPTLYIVDSRAFSRGVVFRYFLKEVHVDFREEKLGKNCFQAKIRIP